MPTDASDTSQKQALPAHGGGVATDPAALEALIHRVRAMVEAGYLPCGSDVLKLCEAAEHAATLRALAAKLKGEV